MITKWHIKNFKSIYDKKYMLSPLEIFYNTNPDEIDSFFESLRMIKNFSDVKFDPDDFFFRKPGETKPESFETNINFTIKTEKDVIIHTDLGLTIGQFNGLYVLSSFLTREIDEDENLFVKYFARTPLEYFAPGKTIYNYMIDIGSNRSSKKIEDDYMIDPYSGYKAWQSYYPDEDYTKSCFTYPYVDVRGFLPEYLIYPDIESVYSFNKRQSICRDFYRLLCAIPVNQLETRKDAKKYADKMLSEFDFDGYTANILLDLLITPQDDFYPNCLSYVIKIDNYFSDYKCSSREDSSYCISLTDWYFELSNLTIQQKDKFIDKIQNDVNSKYSDINECLNNCYQSKFNLKTASRYILPFHLKEAKDYVEKYFSPEFDPAHPCIIFFNNISDDTIDDLYINMLKGKCIEAKPHSSIAIIEPEKYLKQDEYKNKFANLILDLVKNGRQIIIKTNCGLINGKLGSTGI